MPNPLPPQIISLSILTCQTVLHEADGVNSAIRIVDVWNVPELPAEAPPDITPVAQGNALIMLKAEPGYQHEHELSLKFQNPLGEVSDLIEPLKTKIVSTLGQDIPGGATINAQLNIVVKRLGTCYLLVYLDGELAARTPITLRRTPSVESKG
jgi:hypothetical protein